MTTTSEMYAEECKQHAYTKRELREARAELAQARAQIVAGEAQGMTTPGLREEVISFAWAMEMKLRANDHKGGWKNCREWWLMDRLKDELEELAQAFIDGGDVLSEAADVANFAMMFADVCGVLPSRRFALPAPDGEETRDDD